MRAMADTIQSLLNDMKFLQDGGSYKWTILAKVLEAMCVSQGIDLDEDIEES